MKKLVKLLTQIRNTLPYVISALGIVSFFSYDVTSMLIEEADKAEWWKVRMIVVNSGYVLLALVPKFFTRDLKLNLLLNVGIFIFVSDLIGRLMGDTDRDIYDWIWTLITISFCYYEYRKRRLRT